MQFSTIFSAASIFLAVAASPTELIQRQSNTSPIDTAPLYLGACLAMGTCYYEGSTKGCMTSGCSNATDLGAVCSCNADVQKAITLQSAKGQAEWPVKCAY